jgi:stearoyl-CoA desaturase (delta-9 desaturase)
VPGIIMIAVQMLAMPVLAAGVINGFGHSIGYRTYEVENASTNIVPWGLIIGGEELHNNHHAFPSSAKFSVQPWEFDLGWLCLMLLKSLGLAEVKRVAPRPCVIDIDQQADPHAVHAVIHNRMHVLRAYAMQVVTPVLAREFCRDSRRRLLRTSRKLLTRSPVLLDADDKHRLQVLLEAHPPLKVVHDCQEQLRQLWETVNPAGDDAVRMFRSWCARADASGIKALEDFAGTLRRFSFVGDSERGHARLPIDRSSG